MNILKKISFLIFFFLSICFFSCSKDLHFSGISQSAIDVINDGYLIEEYSKDEIAKLIGTPIVQENSGDLWIYHLEKKRGDATFQKTIYNKTLKLKFENNILRSVEEIYTN